MTNLILDSLEIQGFRAFKHLTIEKLGRVNLIVGKNSVGKSSVLEALRIYASRGSISIIDRILRDRSEGAISSRGIGSNIDPVDSIRNLFYGREKGIDESYVELGPLSQDSQKLFVKLKKYLQMSFLDMNNDDAVTDNGNITDDIVGAILSVKYGLGSEIIYPIPNKRLGLATRLKDAEIAPLNTSFVSSGGLSGESMAQVWDDIVLTDFEPLVISSLQIIAPEIERLSFLIDRDPTPVVRIKNTSLRIPLSSLGEGMTRMLGIALSLVTAKNGLLLIDEIESGLHYSIQPDMWKLIFETARRLNIQIVATTHSWDCIQGFQQAAQEDQQSEGVLIRLGRKQEEIVATLYSEQDLEIVTREQIEVR